MIKPIQYDGGRNISIQLAVSETITKGMGLCWSSGYLSEIGTTTEDIQYVSLEDVTTDGSSHTEILCVPTDGIRFECDCDDVVSIVDRGVYCDMASSSTVNPDGTTEKVFLIDKIIGAAETSKLVEGYFKRFKAT